MAFNQDGLKLIAPGGTIAATYPDSGTTRNVYHYITNDDLATVLADAYFDGVASDPLLAGDIILASVDIDGSPQAVALAVTVGGSDVTVQLSDSLVQTLATAQSFLARGIVRLSGTATFTIGDPAPGVPVYIVQDDASTGAIVIPGTTDVFFGFGSNRKMTSDAANEAVILMGVTNKIFAILSNVGSVAFATT